MIKGIGLDMIDLDRVAAAVKKNNRFVERILTTTEIRQYEKYKGARQIEYLAGRFAAKEAYAKAIGTGFGKGLHFTDIEILQDADGKPHVVKPTQTDTAVFVSITHTGRSAAAQIIIEWKEGN